MTTRSARKKPRRTGRVWPDDVKERALELLRTSGVAAAHHELGIPKGTLTRWAKANSIDLSATQARTAAAAQARATQLTTDTTARLDQIIELATRGLIRRLEANADAAELDDTDLGHYSTELGHFVPPDDAEAAQRALRRYRHLATLEPTRDLVGTLTRAVHDLSLLRGDATERGDVRVTFGIPRPSEPDKVDTIDTGGE